MLIKNLLAANELIQTKNSDRTTANSDTNIAAVEQRPCMSENGKCNYKTQIVWQNVLMGPNNDGNLSEVFKEHSNLIGVSHEMWYCTSIDDRCPKKHSGKHTLESDAMDRMMSSKVKDSSVVERTSKSGPSPEQLSLVFLRLREEVCSLKIDEN